MLPKYFIVAFLATAVSGCADWKAKKGDCDIDWQGNCYNACVREAKGKDCPNGYVSSDIVDGGCWNPLQSKCSCHCC